MTLTISLPAEVQTKLEKRANAVQWSVEKMATHLLDEAPVPTVVMAVEEAAAQAHLPPRKVWRNVARLAQSLSVHRRALWA